MGLIELDKYATLENNWDGEGSPSISDDAIDCARELINKGILSGFYIFPTQDGGISFEYPSMEPPFLSVEIMPRNRVHVLFEPEAERFEEFEHPFSIDTVSCYEKRFKKAKNNVKLIKE